jgi:hypothetical protein
MSINITDKKYCAALLDEGGVHGVVVALLERVQCVRLVRVGLVPQFLVLHTGLHHQVVGECAHSVVLQCIDLSLVCLVLILEELAAHHLAQLLALGRVAAHVAHQAQAVAVQLVRGSGELLHDEGEGGGRGAGRAERRGVVSE